MQKIFLTGLFMISVALSACSKTDPILPGIRTSVFLNDEIIVLNKNIPTLSENIIDVKLSQCPYTQDNLNIIRNGNKKIFSGFPVANFVDTKKQPVCKNGFVYVGLTTGEVVKVSPKTKEISWVADVYKKSNMTGGSAILDIISPIVIEKNYVYAGGLGDAFCKISDVSGNKEWCTDIGTAMPFMIIDEFAFVAGTDNRLYAISTKDGGIYWRAKISEQSAPIYKNNTIIIGDEIFDAKNGEKIDD
jgi:outer membrane protein assembly factor BamB